MLYYKKKYIINTYIHVVCNEIYAPEYCILFCKYVIVFLFYFDNNMMYVCIMYNEHKGAAWFVCTYGGIYTYI